LCLDCPQVVPIAGDLTMNGENRHIYRLGYQAAQSFGVKEPMFKYNCFSIFFLNPFDNFNSSFVQNLRFSFAQNSQ
jgi:hypothetical protein